MADKQTVLANSIDTFIGQFVMRGIDFHIGMVTTDVSSTTSSYWTNALPGYVTPNRGRLISRYSEKFISSSSTNVVEKVKANAQGRDVCLVVDMPMRRVFRTLLSKPLPDLSVLAFQEIPNDVPLKVDVLVGMQDVAGR